METPNQNHGKKQILYISRNNKTTSEITSLLSDRYSFFLSSDLNEGLQLLEQHYDYIAAILIDASFVSDGGEEFIRNVADETQFMFIPMILIASRVPSNDEINCLSMGVVDIIGSPFHKQLTLKRIENAIRIKDSASFYEIERMLKALPSNIYLKDVKGRYIFATQYWHHLEHGDDPEWTIRGKTDVDVRKDKENAKAALEADMELMRTGKGTSYVIEINEDDIQEFFEIIKQPVWDDNGKICGIVGLINNVTEQEKMRHKLKFAAETDGLTGLLNRSSIQAMIETSLTSMKNGGKGFSLVMLDIDNFKRVNDTYGHKEGDLVIKALADKMREKFNADISGGRWGGEEFMMLLEKADLAAAVEVAEEIRKEFGLIELPGIPPQTISLGVSEAADDDTIDTLCTRVDMCLYNSKKSGKNMVSTTIYVKNKGT